MTQAEVIRAVGLPRSKSAQIEDGVSVEKWIYKETTWDQGGWSWNRTVSDSAVVFQNGRVVSFGVEKETPSPPKSNSSLGQRKRRTRRMRWDFGHDRLSTSPDQQQSSH